MSNVKDQVRCVLVEKKSQIKLQNSSQTSIDISQAYSISLIISSHHSHVSM